MAYFSTSERAFLLSSFNELILDLYKFQSADELAKKDIPRKRLEQYKILHIIKI